MDDDTTAQDEVERLRNERDEWRRRAEVAEAVAVERLARAEAAERALATAEAALASASTGSRPARPGDPQATATAAGEGAAPGGEADTRPKSLRERWRRYTETIN